MWKWVDKPEYVTSILTLLYCHRIYSVFSYLETINDIIWDGSLVIRPTGHNQSQVSTSLKKENQICTPERNNLYWKGNGSVQYVIAKKTLKKQKKKTGSMCGSGSWDCWTEKAGETEHWIDSESHESGFDILERTTGIGPYNLLCLLPEVWIQWW